MCYSSGGVVDNLVPDKMELDTIRRYTSLVNPAVFHT